MSTRQTANQQNQKIKLTKLRVDSALSPETGQIFIRDTELKGFALRVTRGSKAFIIEKRVDNKVRRITLGQYPEITVEQARKEAHKLLGKIATGVNPIAEKARHQLEGTTLEKAYQDFLVARKSLKPKTLYDYQRLMEVAFGDWQNRHLLKISKDMVAKRHAQIGEQRGEAYANLAMRFLRSLFNFAIAQYEGPDGVPLLRDNPVARLTQTRAWYRVERRQTVIKTHQLPAWYQAVEASRHDVRSKQAGTIADYLLFLLFTGMRREEAAQLTWDRVDLKQKTLLIQDTKNRQPLTLPLSDFLVELLSRRQDQAKAEQEKARQGGEEAGPASQFVFTSKGERGYLQEPRKQMHHIMVASGIEFTLHDLRRTFITVAESLDISAYALKRLVNHKMSGDVTAGYIVADVERLRAPMEKVASHLLECMGQANTKIKRR